MFRPGKRKKDHLDYASFDDLFEALDLVFGDNRNNTLTMLKIKVLFEQRVQWSAS